MAGVIQILSRTHALIALQPPSPVPQIAILGELAQNRSFDGDRVIVRLLAKPPIGVKKKKTESKEPDTPLSIYGTVVKVQSCFVPFLAFFNQNESDPATTGERRLLIEAAMHMPPSQLRNEDNATLLPSRVRVGKSRHLAHPIRLEGGTVLSMVEVVPSDSKVRFFLPLFPFINNIVLGTYTSRCVHLFCCLLKLADSTRTQHPVIIVPVHDFPSGMLEALEHFHAGGKRLRFPVPFSVRAIYWSMDAAHPMGRIFPALSDDDPNVRALVAAWNEEKSKSASPSAHAAVRCMLVCMDHVYMRCMCH